jgi:hypothetical protein
MLPTCKRRSTADQPIQAALVSRELQSDIRGQLLITALCRFARVDLNNRMRLVAQVASV